MDGVRAVWLSGSGLGTTAFAIRPGEYVLCRCKRCRSRRSGTKPKYSSDAQNLFSRLGGDLRRLTGGRQAMHSRPLLIFPKADLTAPARSLCNNSDGRPAAYSRHASTWHNNLRVSMDASSSFPTSRAETGRNGQTTSPPRKPAAKTGDQGRARAPSTNLTKSDRFKK